jgi:small basic protein (TIGR04137 family)
MSLDRSLKTGNSLAGHRNVLSRPERIARLGKTGKFDMAAGDPLNLPKVGNRKLVTGGKKEKKDATAAAAAAAPAKGKAKGK